MTHLALAWSFAANAVSTDDGADNVRPGWIPFFIVLAIGAVIAFLYFSMKKQLGRINIPEDGTPTTGGAQTEADGDVKRSE
jgi:hypothetical protein